jgi:SAM-dependent methyltransferase
MKKSPIKKKGSSLPTKAEKKKTVKKAGNIWKDRAITKIDLGCGENKMPDCIGVDFRKMNGVDIVQNLTLFPWKNIPSEVADVVMSSHLLEHINPDSPDPRLAGLLDLLLQKKIITQKEVDAQIGDYRFLGGFVRFMDEVWRTLKPGGQFISTFPYGGSTGYWQDPTHVNPITHVTLAYFDPLARDSSENLYHLYTIYRPKPWKIIRCFYDTNGFVEVAMEKRLIDKSYNTLDDGLNSK